MKRRLKIGIVAAGVVALGAATPAIAGATPALSCDGRTATIVAKLGQVTWGTDDADVIIVEPGTSAAVTRIHAKNGNDLICGGSSADEIHAGGGDDRILGGDGNDVIYAARGSDFVNAGRGDDWVDDGGVKTDGQPMPVGDGDDVIHGAAGNDTLRVGFGKNKVFGEDANDTIWAVDSLYDDTIDGGGGEDNADIDQTRNQGSDPTTGVEVIRPHAIPAY